MPVPRWEILAGVIDGVNTVFTSSLPYTPGSTAVFLNGQLKRLHLPGILDGWVETDPTTGTVTLDAAPLPDEDVVQMFYLDTTPVLPGIEIIELEGTIEEVVALSDGLLTELFTLAGTVDDVDEIDGLLRDVEAFQGIIEDVQEIQAVLEVCP